MRKIHTPFPTTGYYGKKYFCDREDEIKSLINNANAGQSTTITAIRRIGKTGLIKHLQKQMSSDWMCIYTDILPTENLNDLLSYLATAIIKSVPEKSSFGQKIWNVIKSLRPVISYDALTSEPNLTFDLQPNESKLHIETLFDILESQNKRVLFAIDEFQQILSYPEKNIDSWLRTKIQYLQNVVFIFSGSRQHLMNDLFSNPALAFFRSTTILNLEKIDKKKYCKFIIEKFSEGKKTISIQDTMDILNWTNTHTYYVQLLCSRVFQNSKKIVDDKVWKEEGSKLLKEQEYVFYTYRDMLTKQQWQLLKAIALEQEVYEPTSKSYMGKHKLGGSSNVLRALESLNNKELVYSSFNSDGKKFYSVYDVLFQRWIEGI
ncbi:MAG: ATP-binding protein [Bacteroidales bacterium]|nr:ATP-binding protein [Bacteroidales bacterium]